MKLNRTSILIAVACLGASACRLPSFGGQAKAPTGQSVATVDGREVTMRELQAELGGMAMPTDPKLAKQVQIAALQQIISRRLLAKAAVDQGLDKTPDFALQKARADDVLLSGALQAKIVASVPAPSHDEAEAFVNAHPDVFAQRKIFTMDQIRIQRPSDALLKEIKPLNSLDDVSALLIREKVAFQRGTATLDSVGQDPKLIDVIMKLPANAVFLMPAGNLELISQIKAIRIEPFTGEPAITYAMKGLKRQQAQAALYRQVMDIYSKGKAGVTYNPAFQPPPPPAPAKPATAG